MENYSLLLSKIRDALPELELRENVKMSEYCSFRIGGAAPCMALPSSAEETAALNGILREEGIKPLLMGNGTNLLITDEPLDRFVIRFGDNMGTAELVGEAGVRAGCGISLARLAVFCAEHSLSGLEFAHGIPGTLGGAVSMNAGAYGGEMKDVLASVLCLNGEHGLQTLEAGELELSYRHSVFSGTETAVLGAELELKPGDGDEIRARMRELAEKRRASQPLDKPSAGSTFKRPADGYAAALIDQAGLRGFAIGGAQVSEKHAGFIVNMGGATEADVRALVAEIQRRVLLDTGVQLERELKYWDEV